MTPVLFILLLGCRETLYSPAATPEKNPTDAWAAVLAEVVDDQGYVDYERLAAERAALDQFVAWLADDDSLDRNKLTEHHPAYWLNAFNALVLFQVLERGTPASVLDVPSLLPMEGAGFFVTTQFDVATDYMSLAEIRDERLRWFELDYQVHAAMIFGASGGPPASRELYGGGQIDAQLRRQMSRWVNDPTRGVRVEGNEAEFSPLFETYARDFDFFSAGLDPCTLAARYANGSLRSELERLAANGCPRTYRPMDWSLNRTR